jgi:hypothetical protein
MDVFFSLPLLGIVLGLVAGGTRIEGVGHALAGCLSTSPFLVTVGVVTYFVMKRIRVIRRVRREGIPITGRVREFQRVLWLGILQCDYEHQGAWVNLRLWWGSRSGMAHVRRGSIDLLINPSNPLGYVVVG